MEVRVQCPGWMEDSPSNFLLRLIQCPQKYVNQFHVHSKLDSLCCLTLPQQMSTRYHFYAKAVDDTIKVGKVCKKTNDL
jgi:hypothetical protein